ncbi:MAG: thiol peroxidase [Flavobacteriales bacterium]|nr:thiol peroxidase [Flavobacteriales bacterium]
MSRITFKNDPIETSGTLPETGSTCPNVSLTKTDLSQTDLSEYRGKRVILNIFPSIDTGICAKSTREFNKKASEMDNAVVVCVSKDLPFAHSRFCEAEGLKDVVCTSSYKDSSFENGFNVTMKNGPLAGLFSRAIVVLDEEGKVSYSEQVPEIVQEPDYEKALAILDPA